MERYHGQAVYKSKVDIPSQVSMYVRTELTHATKTVSQSHALLVMTKFISLPEDVELHHFSL